MKLGKLRQTKREVSYLYNFDFRSNFSFCIFPQLNLKNGLVCISKTLGMVGLNHVPLNCFSLICPKQFCFGGLIVILLISVYY
jgi:hypothetical protein